MEIEAHQETAIAFKCGPSCFLALQKRHLETWKILIDKACHIILCCNRLCHIKYTVLNYLILEYVILDYATLDYAILDYAILHDIIQYHIIMYFCINVCISILHCILM